MLPRDRLISYWGLIYHSSENMADKDKLYQQAVLNIAWSRQFISEADFQRIGDALATANGSTYIIADNMLFEARNST